MLHTSRALAHAPRRPFFAGVSCKSIQRFSQSLKFSTTSASAHPAIFLDVSEDRIQTRPAHRHISRHYTTSPQTLQQLVTEGKYKRANAMLAELQTRGDTVRPHPVYAKAVEHLLSQRVLGENDYETLNYWFQLLPDAQHSNPLFLMGSSQDFRHHANADPHFIAITGRILARKGYKGLVEDDILPLARETLENDAFASLEQDLSRSLAHYSARVGSGSSGGLEHSEVFEDASDDYTSVMSASAPPPPSVLEVVEATLPHILPAPDVADRSVFEDEMDEDYLIHQPITQQPPRQSAADKLLHLVTTAGYDDALHLFNELEQLQITIPFSHDYEAAVLNALRRPLADDYTLEDQLKLFTRWFSLVPPQHESSGQPGSNQLTGIRREIMNSLLTNIPLVMRFLSILVEKGYSRIMGKGEVGVVMRFAPANEVVPYVQQLENAYSSYCEKNVLENASSQVKQFSGTLRTHAIRCLASAGRVEEAVSLLPAKDSGVWISLFSCERLLVATRDSNNPSFLQYIPSIEATYERLAGSDKLEQLRRMHEEVENKAMAAQLSTASAEEYLGAPLPKTLRYLKRVLGSKNHHPHPFVIAEFLERYLATGRTRAPTLLLNIAAKSCYTNRAIFLFAEMLYYRRLGQHHLVIQTFADHFYLSGVPREEIMKLVNEIERLQSQPQDADHSSPYPQISGEESINLTRICKFDNLGPTGLPGTKAWPMKLHCNIVWHALVALTPTDHELENLYSKLLNVTRGFDPFRNQRHLEKLRPLLAPSTRRGRIDHAAFTPFMRRLMLHSGANRGARILQDMIDLGIQPSIYHYTELAGFYARLGEVEPAMNILTDLERSSGLYERLKRQKQDHHLRTGRGLAIVSTGSYTPQSLDSPSPSQTPSPQVYTAPEPDLIFYICIMRGFILSRNPRGFDKVHGALNALKRYLPKKKLYKDQTVILNDVYQDFRVMSAEMGYDYKVKRKSKVVELKVRGVFFSLLRLGPE
ncbi:hypothetical protein D9756_006737 [Leucocoprinus leucothites]|uniref:Uncharacterized protein n=1 Tax=Leucocoprinus leucothites TaxID=201217 RepID=A0A8H5G2A0_9AGAR|nr:hypothetical protein D9756_006737 [Leucoagaricus leucothites]